MMSMAMSSSRSEHPFQPPPSSLIRNPATSDQRTSSIVSSSSTSAANATTTSQPKPPSPTIISRPANSRSRSSQRASGSGSGSGSASSPHLDINPSDTTRRVNYRPTPLPSDHIANQVGSPRSSGMYRLSATGEARNAGRDAAPEPRSRSGSVSGSRPGNHARWLSEDEGLGGHGSARTGRFSTARESFDGSLGISTIASGSGSGPSTGSRPRLSRPPSETMHKRARGLRPETTASASRMSSPDGDHATGPVPSSSGRKAAVARQRLRRTHSSEAHATALYRTPSATPSVSLTVGSASDTFEDLPSATQEIGLSGHPIAPSGGLPLPSIEDLVPPPRSRMEHRSGVAAGGLRRADTVADVESAADAFATGSDFASGIGIPRASSLESPIDTSEEVVEEDEARKVVVAKLMNVLGCPACPRDSVLHPVLRQPVTLFCGHTISAAHVKLPSIAHPDLTGMSTLEAEHALIAFQNAKLAAWREVVCPIPICRMHTGLGSEAAATGDSAEVGPLVQDEASFIMDRASHGRIGQATLVSGHLLDVAVDKVLDLVLREQRIQLLAERTKSSHLSSYGLDPNAVTDDEEGSSGHEADGEDDDGEMADFPPEEDGLVQRAHGAPGALNRAISQVEPGAFARSSSKRRRTRSFFAKPDRFASTKRSAQEDSANATGTPASLKHGKMTFERELATIVECDVCTLLLYDPVTTPCQHTFCAKCLARSLDHSTRCPVCRQELPSYTYFQNHSVNKLMLTAILTAFPLEYAERRRGLEAEERDARLNTPIFVCTLGFPGMPTILHIFEPRYRLMLRRCVESPSPRFGMVMPARGNGSATSGLMEYGTMLEIKSIQMLPDGRSMVETMGVTRFRLREKGTLDGYTVGRVDIIEDISPEDEIALEAASIEQARAAAEIRRCAQPGAAGNSVSSPSGAMPAPAGPPTARPLPVRLQSAGALPAPIGGDPPTENEPSTQELMDTCHGFIEQLRSGSAPWLLQRLNNMYGPMPTSPSDFSYWMALIMPIDEYEKARLLPIRSPRLRLRLIVHWVEQLRSSWWFSSGCVTN